MVAGWGSAAPALRDRARLGRPLGLAGEAVERPLRLLLAGIDADHVARPRRGRAVGIGDEADEDELARRVADELVIRKFHGPPPAQRSEPCEFQRNQRLSPLPDGAIT